MGCLQSKEVAYAVPDLQSNVINNPINDTSEGAPLSPKELMMIKRSESIGGNTEESALLASNNSHNSLSPPTSPQKDVPPAVTVNEIESPPPSPSPAAPKMASKKLSVSELLMQEKMKKKHSGKGSDETEHLAKEGWLFRQNEDALSPDSDDAFVKVWGILANRKLHYFEHKVTKADALENFSALGYLDFRPENKAECKLDVKKQGKGGGGGGGGKSGLGDFIFKVRESNISLVFALPTADERDEWAYFVQEAIRGVDHVRKHVPSAASTDSPAKKASRVSFDVIEMPKKEGQLKKLSGQKSKFKVTKLDSRWFRLEAGELKYYADSSLNISKHNKVMPLKGASLSTAGEDNVDENIHVLLADGNSLHMVAPSDVTAAEWRKAIQDSINIIAENMKDNNGKRRRFNLANIQDDHTPIVLDDKVPKNAETIATLTNALQKHFMLSDLTDYGPILDALQQKISLPGDIVIWQESIGDLFFVLERGKVEVIKNNHSVTLLPAGTAFGELALVNDIARAATIRAYSVCHLWTINRKTLRFVLASQADRDRERKIALLKNVPLFKKLNAKFAQIADVMEHATFKKDERVIKQGEAGDFLYLIQSGSVVITKESVRGSSELARLKAGQSFGELALLSNAPRAATITALEPLVVFTIDKATFNNVLGDLAEAEVESMGIEILRKVKLLDGLSVKQLGLIAKHLTKVSYEDGDVIIQQGDEGDVFYMIADGAVNVVVNHAQVAKLSAGSYFGELALMNDDRRNATITALGEVSCLTLGRNEFNELLGPLDELLRAEEERREKAAEKGSLGGKFKNFSKSIFKRDSTKASDSMSRDLEFVLSDFENIRVMGVGRFGSVKLVKHKLTKLAYAMKISHKQLIVDLHNQAAVCNEKEILSKLEHPFIAAMYTTFQTPNSLFMLLEMLPGGEFWSLLHGTNQSRVNFGVPTLHGGLRVSHAQFYFCNVFSAISYLHDQNIIYRDLKPENLVLDRTGYLKLVDFGSSKIVGMGESTNTICGTPEYVAPEMILARGHNKGVDYWTLGIFLYELMTRRTPFASTDAAGVYVKIVNPEETLQHSFESIGNKHFEPSAKDLILKLLAPNPGLRIGMRRGEVEEVWAHPFLADFTSADMLLKTCEAPVRPDIDDIFDKSEEDVEAERREREEGVVPFTGRSDTFASF